MGTLFERLDFVARFAEMKLEKLDAKGWTDLRDEVAAFTSLDRFQKLDQGLSGTQAFDRRSGKPPKEIYDTFVPLQAQVRDVLYSVVDMRDLLAEKQTQKEVASVPIPAIPISARYFLRPSNPPFTDRNELCILGSERDIFLFTLLDLLASEPTNRLKRCPECQKMFVRVRKQLYCSRKCVNRVNARTWRQTPEGRTKNRARVATHYKNKQRAKYGLKVKISSRKRKAGVSRASLLSDAHN